MKSDRCCFWAPIRNYLVHLFKTLQGAKTKFQHLAEDDVNVLAIGRAAHKHLRMTFLETILNVETRKLKKQTVVHLRDSLNKTK